MQFFGPITVTWLNVTKILPIFFPVTCLNVTSEGLTTSTSYAILPSEGLCNFLKRRLLNSLKSGHERSHGSGIGRSDFVKLGNLFMQTIFHPRRGHIQKKWRVVNSRCLSDTTGWRSPYNHNIVTIKICVFSLALVDSRECILYFLFIAYLTLSAFSCNFLFLSSVKWSKWRPTLDFFAY